MRDRPRYSIAVGTHNIGVTYRRHSEALTFPRCARLPAILLVTAFTSLERSINNMEQWNMPDKARRNSRTSTEVRFVDRHLTSDEKRSYTQWIEAEQHLVSSALEQCAQRGYKGSFSYDLKNKCFIATHICWKEGDVNYAVGISSRAGDVYSALLINAYKLIVLYQFSALADTKGETDWG